MSVIITGQSNVEPLRKAPIKLKPPAKPLKALKLVTDVSNMLTSFHIKNFKSLRDVTLHLGRLNVFVGANASGKSNVFDALRVLKGIGNGYSFSEILNGKPKSDSNDQWEGIRGGSSNAAFDKNQETPIRFDVESRFTRRVLVPKNKPAKTEVEFPSYSVEFLPDICKLKNERLAFNTQPIYDSERIANNPRRNANFRVRYFHRKQGRQPQVDNDAAFPVLGQLVARSQGWDFPLLKTPCRAFLRNLANMQGVNLSPSVLSEYTKSQQVRRMGEQGENFAGLVKNICEKTDEKDAYLQWLRHLRPDEIEDVGVLEGAVSDLMFYVEERGKKFPAPVLSDGTLRFAALAAAFFQPDMPTMMTLEEPENGIHPSRLRLLMELLRGQSARTGTQVFITTHSPTLLDWLIPDDYEHTFFCKREEDTGETTIRSVSDIPGIDDVLKSASLGELFAESWLENAP